MANIFQSFWNTANATVAKNEMMATISYTIGGFQTVPMESQGTKLVDYLAANNYQALRDICALSEDADEAEGCSFVKGLTTVSVTKGNGEVTVYKAESIPELVLQEGDAFQIYNVTDDKGYQ